MEIVAYAPFLARLRSISLVCKRWRAAFLRSVRHLRFSNPVLDGQALRGNSQDQGQARLDAALALFPSLTSLQLCDHDLCLSPPTSLCGLSIYLKDSGGSTLDAYFPRLTRLRVKFAPLRSFTQWVEDQLLGLITRHQSTLTELRFNVNCEPTRFVRKLAAAPLPQLRTLSLKGHVVYADDTVAIEGLLRHAPALTALHVQHSVSNAALCALPASLLAPLVQLRQLESYPANLVEVLKNLPKLRTISPSCDALPYLSYYLEIDSEVFALDRGKLALHRGLHVLSVVASVPPPPSMPSMPAYTTLLVDSGPHALECALALMEASHALKTVRVALPDVRPHGEVRADIARLVEAAVRRSVRRLWVLLPVGLLRNGRLWPHPLAEGGWLTLSVAKWEP